MSCPKKVKWNKVKVTQSCLTLCYPMDYIIHGILQARILEWIAFHFSRGSSQTRDWTQVSHIAGGFFTSWAAREAQAKGWKKKKKSLLFLRRVNCATQGWGVSTSWRFSGIDTTSLIVCYQVGDYIHMKLHFIQDFTIFSITRSNNYTTCYTCHESLFHKIFF